MTTQNRIANDALSNGYTTYAKESGLYFGNNTGVLNSNWNTTADLTLDVDGEEVSLSEFIKGVKESLGQSPVILKCGHCGQWGAKFCACRYCGAPIG